MARAVVVYASRKGSTRRIAEWVGEGLQEAGVEVKVRDADGLDEEREFVGYDIYVFGSPTYHGEMLAVMKRVLFQSDKIGLRGRIGGSFGAFGWSGEAPGRIFATMRHILGMRMVDEPLRVKSPEDPGAAESAKAYGRSLAAQLNGVEQE